MAAPDFATIADRVYREFMAPLVLGGAMRTHRAVGSKVALAIGEQRVAGDAELVSHVVLARVRRARGLVAIDRFDDATPTEWALACALHDVVHAGHPGFDAMFKRASASKLLDMVERTLERTPPPTSLRDAVSRHTWFSRLFEIARTDTDVAWWVGSSHFKGVEPPSRLMAWPELRRVNVTRTPRALMDLPAAGAAIDAATMARVVRAFLSRTPLTDLATCARTSPPFAWSAPTLALAATRGGRTLATRALARQPKLGVDAALGRATRDLFAQKAWAAAKIALELLADRALAEALADGGASGTKVGTPDAALARSAGALLARARIVAGDDALSPTDRARVLAALEPLATSAAARDVEAQLGRG